MAGISRRLEIRIGVTRNALRGVAVGIQAFEAADGTQFPMPGEQLNVRCDRRLSVLRQEFIC